MARSPRPLENPTAETPAVVAPPPAKARGVSTKGGSRVRVPKGQPQVPTSGEATAEAPVVATDGTPTQPVVVDDPGAFPDAGPPLNLGGGGEGGPDDLRPPTGAGDGVPTLGSDPVPPAEHTTTPAPKHSRMFKVIVGGVIVIAAAGLLGPKILNHSPSPPGSGVAPVPPTTLPQAGSSPGGVIQNDSRPASNVTIDFVQGGIVSAGSAGDMMNVEYQLDNTNPGHPEDITIQFVDERGAAPITSIQVSGQAKAWVKTGENQFTVTGVDGPVHLKASYLPGIPGQMTVKATSRGHQPLPFQPMISEDTVAKKIGGVGADPSAAPTQTGGIVTP